MVSPLHSPSGSRSWLPRLAEPAKVMLWSWLWFQKNRAGSVSSFVLPSASKVSKDGMLDSSSSGSAVKVLPWMLRAVTLPAPAKLNASGSKHPMLQYPRLLGGRRAAASGPRHSRVVWVCVCGGGGGAGGGGGRGEKEGEGEGDAKKMGRRV